MENTDDRFGRSITRLTKEAHRYFSQALAPLGLAPGMQAYLLILPSDSPLPQKDLSDLLLVDPANVTRALKNFEHRGWVRRTRSPGDAKEWLVSLTAQGKKIRQKAADAAAAHTALVRQRLTAEQWKELTDLLETASVPVAKIITTL